MAPIVQLLTLVFLIISSGCSSFQTSNYVNYNTPYGNVIKASGRAADNAAQANNSYNCPSCTMSSYFIPGQSGRKNNNNYTKQSTYLNDISQSTIRTLSNEVTRSINEAMRDSF
jgi:uncharacterized protein (UPF0333 family)